jgi:hypothetical protein
MQLLDSTVCKALTEEGMKIQHSYQSDGVHFDDDNPSLPHLNILLQPYTSCQSLHSNNLEAEVGEIIRRTI